MTLTTGRVPRRTLLIALMGIFTLGNAMSASADSYTWLLLARVLTSFTHGAFFGVGAVVASTLVPPDKRAGAVAAMFMGLTIATVGGVPVSAWAAEQFGWRSVFWAITAMGVVAMVSLRFAVPYIAGNAQGNVRAELSVLTRRPVLKALAMTVIASSAMFTVFTYIAPILLTRTHASPEFVAWMLVLYGLGLTAGNWLGGHYADRSIDGTLIVTLAGTIVLLVLFSVAMQWQLPSALLIFLWGITSFAVVAPLQTRVMTAASDAPTLASAVNIGAFNLGNAVGAAVGGGVIRAGLGLPAVSLAGALMAVGGLVAVLAWRDKPAGPINPGGCPHLPQSSPSACALSQKTN